MSVPNSLSQARKHWMKWLPAKIAALKANGTREAELQMAARNAQHRVNELMERGYRQHAAEEVARAEFILLRPESEADLEPWERRELAQKEREYQKMMKGTV